MMKISISEWLRQQRVRRSILRSGSRPLRPLRAFILPIYLLWVKLEDRHFVRTRSNFVVDGQSGTPGVTRTFSEFCS